MNAFDEQRLREMRLSGHTSVEIAEELGLTPGQVKDICETVGIPSARPNNLSWEDSARNSTDMLIWALRKAHPERCST